MDLTTISDDTDGYVIVITKASDDPYSCLISLGSQDGVDKDTLPDDNYVTTVMSTKEAAHGHEGETDIVYSEDVALETVVMTTTTTANEDLVEEDLRVPFMGQIVEVQENDSSSRNDSQPSLNPITPSPSGYEEDFLNMSSTLTAKEIRKRDRDRLYKQQQRQNPEYKAKERVKSRQRMKDKRKDLLYREVEREKDRVRRKQVREENTEFREREKQRDREYRRQLKSGEKIKANFSKSIALRNNLYEENLSDSESDNYVSVENCYTCQNTVPNFLGGRGNIDLQVSGDHILSLHGGVSDSDGYSSSDRNEQFEMTFNN